SERKLSTMKKKLALSTLVAVGALGLWIVVPASAQDHFIGAKKIPGDPYVSSGCGSSWEICNQRRAARSNPRVAQANGTVPKFCYSLKTGKFTHWGPCRVVTLPTGQRVKVAH